MKRLVVFGLAVLLTAFVGAQEFDTLFFDGFESGDLSAWGTGLIPVQWHITSGSHAIEGNSWWSGNEDLGGYGDYWMHLLVTPDIELPASPSGNLVLSASVNIGVEEPPTSPTDVGGGLLVDGWDGAQVRITTDGGTTWHLLEPEGGYPCHMMFGFIVNEGDTTLAAGWGGSFSGDVTFDLSEYAGQTVKIAFVMASDVSYSTSDDPSLFGFVVDNIEVSDDADTYFQENADDHTNPMDTINMSVSAPQPTVTDVRAYEGTYSCFAQNVYSAVYELVTPTIHIPDGFLGSLSFAVYRDAPDWEGPDSDTYIDDLYLIYISTDNGFTWQRVAADWYHEDIDPTWVECTSNSDLQYIEGDGLNLYDFMGQDIKIKFLFVFDDNNDGGAGTGFYLDNVAVTGFYGSTNDAGIKEITTGPVRPDGPITLTFGVYGYGVETATPRVHYAVYDSATGTEITSDDLGLAAVGLFEEKFVSATWTPDGPGTYNIVAWTTYALDEDNSNDTAMITLHINDNLWELGYDDGAPDTYSVVTSTDTYGPFIYFINGLGDTIETYQDGISVLFDSPFSDAVLTALSFRGVGAGNVAFKIFDYNETDGIGGYPIAEYEFALPEDFPTDLEGYGAWVTFPVTDSFELPEQFAVLVCAADSASWVYVGADRDASEFRSYFSEYDPTFGFYTHVSQDMFVPYIDSVGAMIRCTVARPAGIEEKDVAALPASPVLLGNTPNPFNPVTEIRFQLPASDNVKLEVLDVDGKVVKTLVDGEMTAGVHAVRWDGTNSAGEDVPSGVYFYKLTTSTGTVARKMTLVK